MVPVNFDAYELDAAVFDEMFDVDGAPRPPARDLYETLGGISSPDLSAVGEWVPRSFTNEGITFTVYGDDEETERIIPIDCIPRVMSAAEWSDLTAGLEQRLSALNLFLQDIYGEARIIEIAGRSDDHATVLPSGVQMGVSSSLLDGTVITSASGPPSSVKI